MSKDFDSPVFKWVESNKKVEVNQTLQGLFQAIVNRDTTEAAIVAATLSAMFFEYGREYERNQNGN